MIATVPYGLAMEVIPVVLEGEHIRLEPAAEHHVAGLWRAGSDPGIWRYMPYMIRSEDDMRRLIERARSEAESGRALLFANIDRGSGEPIGTTGYWAIDTFNHRLEIGATWVTPKLQRTAVNTEAKFLLLQHCFEALGCIRVEFKTDSLNQTSRAALARVGAVEEGIFRNHMIMPDGRYRHSVYFSIVDSEWPEVRQRLLAKLGRESRLTS